jgi:hypothetical protein
MKAKILLISLVSFIFLNNRTYSQGEAAVPFLLIQPSPSLSAMGATGTALPTEDPFGFIWNPAQLGYNSLTNNLSFIFYPSKVEWHPALNAGLELNAVAFNAGYNFEKLIGFPLSFGFGYSRTNFNLGSFLSGIYPSNTFEPREYYNAYSFGLGVDYFVQLSIGYTIKNVTSILLPYPGEPYEIQAETKVNDYGILLNVPIIKLIDDELQLRLDESLFTKPKFNFSLGYSKSNIGDSIYYIDPAQADPLPRMDRIGYGISTGFDLISDDFKINAFNLAFTVEADDILITRDGIWGVDWEYQSTLSDLKFWKNVVQIEGDDNIVSHAGLRIDFVETFSLYFGHFSGRGFYQRETNGYEIRAKGLFKLWALWAKDPITDFFRDHFDIRYYNTNYFADHALETKMTGLAFYIHNLDSLF